MTKPEIMDMVQRYIRLSRFKVVLEIIIPFILAITLFSLAVYKLTVNDKTIITQETTIRPEETSHPDVIIKPTKDYTLFIIFFIIGCLLLLYKRSYSIPWFCFSVSMLFEHTIPMSIFIGLGSIWLLCEGMLVISHYKILLLLNEGKRKHKNIVSAFDGLTDQMIRRKLINLIGLKSDDTRPIHELLNLLTVKVGENVKDGITPSILKSEKNEKQPCSIL